MSERSLTAAKEGLSELGVALLLGALGTWAIVDARSLGDLASRGAVGAKTVPLAVGFLLIFIAIALTIDVLRGGRGEIEGGEDVELGHGSDWKTIALLIAAFAANAALIEPAGWPISGAILFFGASYALGGRHYIRMALISLALSFGTWYLFFFALGVKLPTGLLTGII